jgi:glycerol-3-phosphate dehydrogenase
MIDVLSGVYGAQRDRVLRRVTDDQSLAARLNERQALPGAAVAEAVENEMAQNLDDILWRRTTLGDTGLLTETAVAAVAAIAATRLGWDKKRTHQEVKQAMSRLEARNMR